MSIFGREPAQWVGVLSGFLMLLAGAGLFVGDGQVDAIQGVITALAAVATAAATRPLAVSAFQQLVKALVVLFLVFGVELSVELQTAIVLIVEPLFNFAMRPSVTPTSDPRPL